MKKLLDIAKQLKTVSGLITSIVIIGGATLWFDSRDDRHTEAQEGRHDTMMDSIASVKQVTEWNNIEIGQLAERQEAFHDTLNEYKNKVDILAQKHVKEIVGDSSLTRGEFIREMDGLMEYLNDIKKNNELLEKVDLEWPDWFLIQPSTDLILSEGR